MASREPLLEAVLPSLPGYPLAKPSGILEPCHQATWACGRLGLRIGHTVLLLPVTNTVWPPCPKSLATLDSSAYTWAAWIPLPGLGCPVPGLNSLQNLEGGEIPPHHHHQRSSMRMQLHTGAESPHTELLPEGVPGLAAN